MGRIRIGIVLLVSGLIGFAPRPAHAIELRNDTVAAYNRYLAAAERRIASETQNGPFLLIDSWTGTRREEAYAELHRGAILAQPVNTLENGRPIVVPHGLIHDWAGVLFVPDVSLAQTLAVVQDYRRYQDFFKPDIRDSRVVRHSDDNYIVAMQLYRKSIVTVAINAQFEVHYTRVGPHRETVRSCATRLAEVEDVGQPRAREDPPGQGPGYLWRLCDFWRFEERDGGVYIQLESIDLSRSVPGIVAWIIDPLLRTIPRGTVTDLLGALRKAVVDQTERSQLFYPAEDPLPDAPLAGTSARRDEPRDPSGREAVSNARSQARARSAIGSRTSATHPV